MQKVETEINSYPENTDWKPVKKMVIVSSDGVHNEAYVVRERMYKKVKISILPDGKVDFTIQYPFDDVSAEEQEKMIKEAKAAFPDLASASV
jgi:hypothetical protein